MTVLTLTGLLQSLAPALEAAGRQLLYSTLVFALVALVILAFRPRSPQVRLALWSLVMIRLVLPVDLASPWSLRGLLPDLSAASPPPASLSPGGSLALEPPAEPAPLTVAGLPWGAFLTLFWLLGSSAFALAFLRRRRQFRRLIAASEEVGDPRLVALLDLWRRRLRIRRPVRWVLGEAAQAPFTLGVLRPVVFVPRRLLDEDGGLVEGVLAHELAHVRRFDDVLLAACRLIQAVYFFHPVAWIAAGKISEECELLCDALVLRRGEGINARAYGRGLLSVLRMDLEPAVAASGVGHSKKQFEQRLRRILSVETRARRAWPAVALTLILGFFVLPLGPAAEPVSPDAPLGRPEAPAASAGSGFQVVVRADNPTASIGRSELSSIFLKQDPGFRWDDGRRAVPIDLESPARDAFSEIVHGRETRDVHKYWQTMIFNGKGVPPPQVSSVGRAFEFLRKNPGSVAYLPDSVTLPDDVRAIEISER